MNEYKDLLDTIKSLGAHYEALKNAEEHKIINPLYAKDKYRTIIEVLISSISKILYKIDEKPRKTIDETIKYAKRDINLVIFEDLRTEE